MRGCISSRGILIIISIQPRSHVELIQRTTHSSRREELDPPGFKLEHSAVIALRSQHLMTIVSTPRAQTRIYSLRLYNCCVARRNVSHNNLCPVNWDKLGSHTCAMPVMSLISLLSTFNSTCSRCIRRPDCCDWGLKCKRLTVPPG